MPGSRLGRGNESLQNEAGRSTLASYFDFVLVKKSTQQGSKKVNLFKIIFVETSMSYRHLTYRPRSDVAWNALCITCIAFIRSTLHEIKQGIVFFYIQQ